MSKMPLVPGPKEARFPHLRHAGPTATSGPHQHRQHHARHDYFRWAATAPGIGDRLNHNDHEYRSRSSVCDALATHYHHSPINSPPSSSTSVLAEPDERTTAGHGRNNVIKPSRSRIDATRQWRSSSGSTAFRSVISQDFLPRRGRGDRLLSGGIYRGSGRIYTIAMWIDCYRSAKTDA